MDASIIKIGNSKGIRLRKDMLAISGISKDVKIEVKPGEIRIIPAETDKDTVDEITTMSEAAFGDWLRPEEEEAWKIYQ